MAVDRGKLLVKSPYYITEAGSAGFTSEIEIRIWNGLFTSEPTSPNYLLTKQVISDTATQAVFEISKIIESSFDHLSNVYTNLPSANTDSLWVNVKSFNGSVNRDDTFIGLDGYSYFNEGLNVNPTDTTLISERILYHYTDIPLRLPVYCSGATNANSVEFRLGTNVVSTTSLTAYTSSLNSYDKVKYITKSGSVSGAIDNILVKNSSGTVLDTISVVPMNCSRYDPYVVSFINKFGVNQELVFNLVSKESIEVDKKSFNRQILDLTGTPTYNTTRHQTKEYNSSVKETITLNSNYIDESLNDTIGQLISSEAVWVTSNGVTYPVNVSTKNLDYKKSVNEGLINYTIKFDYAFNKRNNVY